MKKHEITDLASGIAHMLLSYAAHGLSTSSLAGMGEITLRDGLVVAAAAAGAKTKQAWILDREITPVGWHDAAVDLVVYREGKLDTQKFIGGVELKFWRKEDAGNASNRRRDLIKDFIRAASLYQQVEDFAIVALLSTNVSWESTVDTRGKDKEAMEKLEETGTQKWNIRSMANSSAVKAAVLALDTKISIPNIFHTELAASASIHDQTKKIAFSKVWLVRKPQRSKLLSDSELSIFKKKSATFDVAETTSDPVTDVVVPVSSQG